MNKDDDLTSIKIKFDQTRADNISAIDKGVSYFNPLLAVRRKHDEVGLHSNFIFSLLNPEGNHFKGDLFVKHFLNVIEIEYSNANEVSVFREKGGIDLFIETPSHRVIIENKVYAFDQPKQIERYIAQIQDQEMAGSQPDNSSKSIVVVYLSLTGVRPSKYSLGRWKIAAHEANKSLRLVLLSYRDINDWCGKCLQEIKGNSPVLEISINFYRDILYSLTKTTPESAPPKEGITQRILTNEEFFILKLTRDEQRLISSKYFVRTEDLSEEDRWLSENLIPHASSRRHPKIIVQRSLNKLLGDFKNSLHKIAERNGLTTAVYRNYFSKIGITLLENPVNWYTKKINRSGLNQFIAFKPTNSEDGFWYALYFAKFACYEVFISINNDHIEKIDYLNQDLLQMGFRPHEYAPYKGCLLSRRVGFMHPQHKSSDIVKILNWLENPIELFDAVMKPSMKALWSNLEPGNSKEFWLIDTDGA